MHRVTAETALPRREGLYEPRWWPLQGQVPLHSDQGLHLPDPASHLSGPHPPSSGSGGSSSSTRQTGSGSCSTSFGVARPGHTHPITSAVPT